MSIGGQRMRTDSHHGLASDPQPGWPGGDPRTEADARLERFAQHSSSAIIVADLAAGRVDYCSPAAARIWAPRDCLHTTAEWEASIHPDDRADVVGSRTLALDKGKCQRVQYRIIDEAGATTRRVRETSFAIPSQGLAGAAIGAIVEDVSPDIPVYLVQPPGAPDRALFAALQRMATRITTFSSQEELLNLAEVLNAGCIVVDLRAAPLLPEALHRLLRLRPAELQVVLIGLDDTAPAQIIAALKAGAADYLVDPLHEAALASAIQRACRSLLDGASAGDDAAADLSRRLGNLPRREREVLFGLIEGGTNKSIARRLNISPRTVETHRARLMQRMDVRNLTQLLHLAHDAGLGRTQAGRT